MQIEIISLLIGIVAAVILFRRNPAKITAEIEKEKLNDIELARRSRDIDKSIEQIKKELAEKQTGLKNMTKEQIEQFWKNN